MGEEGYTELVFKADWFAVALLSQGSCTFYLLGLLVPEHMISWKSRLMLGLMEMIK